jgi:hypothetical protein
MGMRGWRRQTQNRDEWRSILKEDKESVSELIIQDRPKRNTIKNNTFYTMHADHLFYNETIFDKYLPSICSFGQSQTFASVRIFILLSD